MFLKVLILSVIIIAISFIGLALRIIFVRGGNFPQFTIGKNKEMQKMGITCPEHGQGNCYDNPGHSDEFSGCPSSFSEKKPDENGTQGCCGDMDFCRSK